MKPAAAVVVIDTATAQVVERITVGKRPRGIRLSRDGTMLFVALSGSPMRRPRRRRVEAAASRSRCRRYRRRRSVRAQARAQPDERSGSGGVRLLARRQDDVRVERRVSGDVSHRRRRAVRFARRVEVGEEPEGVTVRPDGRELLRHVRGRQRSLRRRYRRRSKWSDGSKTAARPRSIAFTKDGQAWRSLPTETSGHGRASSTPRSTPSRHTIVIPKARTATAPRPMGRSALA